MNKLWKKNNVSGFVPIIICSGVYMLLVLIFGLVIAWMIQNESISIETGKWLAYAVSFVASLFSNMLLLKDLNEGFVVRLLISMGAMIIVWAITGMLFFDGLKSAEWGSALAIVAAAVVVFVISYIKPAKNKYKKYGSC